MNKELTIEYLYDVFSFAIDSGVHPKAFFKDLFGCPDFINMMNNRPFDIGQIESLIKRQKPQTFNINLNQIRYLSFLIVEFIDRTTIALRDIPSYIDADAIITNFLYYHSQDIDTVIFDLIVARNQKYKLRKATKEKFLDVDNVYSNFLYLFPIKRFLSFKARYDPILYQTIYVNDDNHILLLSNDIDSLMKNDYFVQRYMKGNVVFCFTEQMRGSNEAAPINLLSVCQEGIWFCPPGGIKRLFSFSN